MWRTGFSVLVEVEAANLSRRLEEAYALARCAAASGGEDAGYDAGFAAGLDVALVMLAELEESGGLLRVTQSTGAAWRG
jgi:hypothetical protein